ncbi:hypothetical protein [Pelomonas sp. KK5]|uniref:competence protein CoiA family protein n=1 Tax=Pelomonas sp. KK5 TaxID=1855730 RepID=UPI00097C0CC2|nr:hypothetical protein [Pelomonas sp. KK5]
MPLIAYRADTDEEVESFTAPAETWAAWRELGAGRFLIGRDRVPAMLKRSSLGLQFFAAMPGYGGTTAPESIEHQHAKVALVQGLRAAGFKAHVERPGSTPSGEEWVADVLAEAGGRTIAFEVQMSRQTWDDYRARTRRYAASGVKCVWLVRSTHYCAFAKAKHRHHMRNGMSYHQALNEALPDMPVFPLVIENAGHDRTFDFKVVVWTRREGDPSMRLEPGSFASGTAAGHLHLRRRGLEGMAWEWSPAAPDDPYEIPDSTACFQPR